MKQESIIGKYADPGTRRIINGVAYYCRRERDQIKRHKRGLWRASAILAGVLGYEYIVVLFFLTESLQGLDTLVMAPVLALIVPLAAAAFHLRTTHDAQTSLRDRLRAFVTPALLILPIALSLGLALTLAQSIVFGGADSGATIGNETITLGAPQTGFTQGVLDVLQEVASLLMLALAASLAISFYVAAYLFRKIERHYLFLENTEDRSSAVLELVAKFQVGHQDFARLERERVILLRHISPVPEERYADEAAFAINKKIASMRKGLAKHQPGVAGRNVFTDSLDPVAPLPLDITTHDEAIARLTRIKDLLRPQAIVTALGAAPPKETPHDA